MKKSLIVTIGVLLILLVVGVWLYLLFFGTPKNPDDVFSNLGIGTPGTLPDPGEENPSTTNLPQTSNPEALRQLTTRPVAGFTLTGTSSTIVRYSERGIGHVYELDVTSGEEKRISGTTIPQIARAVFSPSGNSVVLESNRGYTRELYAAQLSEDTEAANYVTLPDNAFDPVFMSDTDLRLAINTTTGTEGYSYSLTTESLLRQFSIPLSDVKFTWQKNATYVVNKPSPVLQGSLYQITKNSLVPLVVTAYGFMADVAEPLVIYSQISNDEFSTTLINTKTNDTAVLPVPFIPEKCTSLEDSTETVWCASPETFTTDFLERWYQGTIQATDLLWRIDIETQIATLYSDLSTEAGRNIDVFRIVPDSTNTKLYFINKVDNTLWLYDSTIN